MRTRVAVLASMLAVCKLSWGADAFSASAGVNTRTGTQSASLGFNTAEQAFDSLRQKNLSALVPAYTGVEAATVAIDFRGLALETAYPIANNPRLDLNIPSLGISRTFVGATREESRILLRDFFKNGDVLGRIMKDLAKTSPVDPVAGNPNSLQSRMVAQTYERGLRRVITEFGARTGESGKAASERSRWLVAAAGDVPGLGSGTGGTAKPSSASVGLGVAGFRQAGLSTNGVSIPLDYSLASERGRSLSLEGDLQYTDTQGAKTYGLIVGAAYRFAVNDRWYLVPSANFGVIGSKDLGSLATMVSASLTSATRLYSRFDTTLWMGNSVNFSNALKTSIGNYSVDSKLQNVAFVNGLVLSTPLTAAGRNFWVEYSLADTRFAGSALYNQRYDEVGVAIVRSAGRLGNESYLRAGLSYLSGSRSNGVKLNLHYAF